MQLPPFWRTATGKLFIGGGVLAIFLSAVCAFCFVCVILLAVTDSGDVVPAVARDRDRATATPLPTDTPIPPIPIPEFNEVSKTSPEVDIGLGISRQALQSPLARSKPNYLTGEIKQLWV